jgi:hypothetical protein
MNPGKPKGSRPNQGVSITTQANLAEFHARMDQLQAELEAQKLDQAEMAEMKAKLAAQEAELQRLRQQIATKASGLELISDQPQPTSRRAMLKKVGGAAAGLAALSLAAGIVPSVAQAGDPAIDADGTNATDPSYGGRFTGNLAPVRLVPGLASSQTTGTHAAGELFNIGDTAGADSTLWYYRGTTGGWVPLNSTVYLDSPIRIVGPYNSVNTVFASLPGGTTPTYFKIEGTWTNNPPGLTAVTATIPSNAVSVIGTVAIINPAAKGYATLYPANATSIPVIATANYQGGIVTNNSFSCKLGALPNGSGKGIAVITNTAAQIAIDIVGYIL